MTPGGVGCAGRFRLTIILLRLTVVSTEGQRLVVKKSVPHRSVTFKMPQEAYDVVAAYAKISNTDVSSVLNSVLAQAVPQLKILLRQHAANDAPVNIVHKKLEATMGEANAEAAVKMAGIIARDEHRGDAEQLKAMAEQLRRQYRRREGFSLTAQGLID